MPNLATLMVGLGYDLSALEKGAPEAFRLINSQTLGMSAEMKRSAREGSESFRLIDEALGIHVSRPLTRILTQEFPGLAQGLQSLLGVGIVGALGVAGVEAFSKLSEKIEHAQKAEETFQESTRKVGEVFTDTMQSFEKADKLRSLSGIDKTIFDIDYSSVDEGRKKVDELAVAMEKESKDAIEAHKWTTEFLAAVGDGAHVVFNAQSTLGVEAIGKEFEEFVRKFDALSNLDALHGTHESAKALAEEIDKAEKSLAGMTALKITPTQEFLGTLQRFLPGTLGPQVGFSQTEIDRQKQFLENLQKIQQILTASGKDQSGRQDEARKADEAERQLKAQQAIAALNKEIASSIAKLQPETDPIKKLDGEIAGFRSAAEADFRAIGDAVASALELKAEHSALDSYLAKLGKLQTILESDILRGQLPEPLAAHAPQQQSFAGTATPISIATPKATPVLGAGGTTGAQFDAFSKDQGRQLQDAAAAYAALITPQQKYQLAQQELNLLLEKGLIDQTAYTAALQKASEQYVQAEDHLHKMQEDLQKLLERSDDARAGVQAFFLQLEIDSAQNGKFAFDLLNQGLKSFEDELTKAVFTGKAKWEDMFRSMAETAFKFTLNKDIAQLFHLAGNTGIGKSLGLGGLIPSAPSAPGNAALTTAATTLQTGSTTLITAATELQAAATTLQTSGLSGAGGAGGGGVLNELFSGFPGFAGGTDDAPGGFSWVGEQGPELLNLPAGSSVTPSASLRSSGGDSHYYIDAKGAEIGVEEKIVRALQQAEPRFIGKALANYTEVQRRTAGQRR